MAEYEITGEMDGEDLYGEMDGDLEGEEVLGDAEILGALWRRRRARRAKGRGRQFPRSRGTGQPIYPKPPLPHAAAHPNLARLRSFLGQGIAQWAVADATDKPLTVEPQESFRGERLIIDVSTPAGITNAPIVLVRTITVGTMPQSPSVEQPAPAALFRADAIGTKLDLQIAYRSTKLSVNLGITAAPTGAGTITAACGFYGEWIR